jgi:Tol biopolymer transport system component
MKHTILISCTLLFVINICLIFLAFVIGHAHEAWKIAVYWPLQPFQTGDEVGLLDVDRQIHVRLFPEVSIGPISMVDNLSISPNYHRLFWTTSQRAFYYDASIDLLLSFDETMRAFSNPVWSVDSQSFLYEAPDGTLFHSIIGDRQISTEPLFDPALTLNATRPQWSPDGQWIAFDARVVNEDAENNYEVYVTTPDQRWLINVAAGQDYCLKYVAGWLVDTNELLYLCGIFQEHSRPIWQLWKANISLRTTEYITTIDFRYWYSVSPDGSYIAIFNPPASNNSPHAETADLYIMNLSTSETRLLASSIPWPASTLWSPDSNWFIYVDTHQGQSDIVAVHLESGTRRQLTNDDRVEILMR